MYVYGGTVNDLTEINTASGVCKRMDVAAGVMGTQPSGRSSMGFSAEGRVLYVFGGASESNLLVFMNDLYSYNTTTKTWMELNAAAGVTGSPPSVRGRVGMTAHDGSLWVTLGYDKPGGGWDDYKKDSHRYNIATKTWTALGSVSVGREASSACMIGSSLFVFGGWTNHGGWRDVRDLNRLEVGGTSMAWTMVNSQGDIPPVCAGAVLTAVGSKLVLFGGTCSLQVNGFDSDVHVFRPGTDTWTKITDTAGQAPTGRVYLGNGAVIGCKIFYFGGCTQGWPCNEQPSNELFAYEAAPEPGEDECCGNCAVC